MKCSFFLMFFFNNPQRRIFSYTFAECLWAVVDQSFPSGISATGRLWTPKYSLHR